MEFLLKKRKKKMAYLSQKKKSFTTTQHICNMCVFQCTCIVYINSLPPPPHPSSQILPSNKVI